MLGSIPSGPTKELQLEFFLFMRDNCCYILFSNKLNKFYIGACQYSLDSRIQKHNNHEYGNQRFTSTSSDWVLFLKIEVSDYAHAIRIERKIKSMKSKKYIENLRKYPEMIQKIIAETIPSN